MNTREGKAWLALAAIKGIGPKALWQLAEYLLTRQKPASWLLRNPEAIRDALRTSRANIVLPSPGSLNREEGVQEEKGKTTVLYPLHTGFPLRLKDLKDKLSLPAILYARGNLSILERPSASIVGRRNAGPAALSVADKLAAGLAAEGINVTSGYAAGVDSAAHLGALRRGGTTTLVLAEGLGRFHARSEFRGLLSDGNALVVSQFAPGAEWTAYQAMARNKLVAALSAVLVAVASGPERDPRGGKSGTFDAALSAQKFGLPVFVIIPSFFSSPPPGNQELIRKGGRVWDPAEGIDPILEAMKAATKKKVPEQKKLF